MSKDFIKNLKSFKKGEKRAKACGRRGAEKSIQVRKEKKLMSEILLRYLGHKDEKDFYRTLDGVMQNMDASSIQALKLLLDIEAKNVNVNIENEKALFEKLLGGDK